MKTAGQQSVPLIIINFGNGFKFQIFLQKIFKIEFTDSFKYYLDPKPSAIQPGPVFHSVLIKL